MWHAQERSVMYIKYWLENVKERRQLEDRYRWDIKRELN